MNLSLLSTIRKSLFEYAALTAVMVWIVVHANAFLPRVADLGQVALDQIYAVLQKYFLWQGIAFIAFMLIALAFRRSSCLIVCIISLVISSAVLLIKSHDAVFVAKFLVLFFWFLCSANTSRLIIYKLVGPRFATWGLSAAFLYAISVPVAFFLGLAGGISPVPIIISAFLTAMPGLCGGIRYLSGRPWRNWAHSRLDFSCAFLLEIIWLILAITFIGASAVETFSDAARVHLPYVHQVINDQGISHQYACMYRLELMAAQTCFAMCGALGSDVAAKWFLWLALGTIAMLIAEEAYFRSNSLRTGLFAGALSLGCPILNVLSTTLYIDLFITMLCTGGLIALFRALRPASMSGILLSAFIMSAAVQTKYTGLIFAMIWGFVLSGGLLAQCPWRTALRRSLTAGLVLLIAGSPWYIYVYHGTGNPFYPFLNKWFPSPYWTNDISLQRIFSAIFKMDKGIMGVATFPWSATYQTGRFLEGWNGYFGFGLIALAPCLLLAIRKRGTVPIFVSTKMGLSPLGQPEQRLIKAGGIPRINWTYPLFHNYLDILMVGVAMVACVITYTPYIRYWLPAYPLLAAACGMAFCAILHPFERICKGLTNQMTICLVAAGLVIMPAVFVCLQMPWDEYVKKISKEEVLVRHYNGYRAIEHFNTMLEPDAGVLCMAYEGIHLVGGRPYEFSYLTENAHHIDSVDKFADFRQRYNMRYFIVSYNWFRAGKGSLVSRIMDRYCTDQRLVTGAGDTAIYDISDSLDLVRPEMTSIVLPAVIDLKKEWTPQTNAEHWINQQTESNVKPQSDSILVESRGILIHRLDPTAKKSICIVRCNFQAKEECSPVLQCVWFGKSGNKLLESTAFTTAKSDFSLCIFLPPVPDGAETCWLYLVNRGGRPMQLKNTTVTWINGPSTTRIASRKSSEYQ
jgi:hypothetical protein